MANGDASSSDSAPSTTNRPALQQFKKQKEQAAIEGNQLMEFTESHCSQASLQLTIRSNSQTRFGKNETQIHVLDVTSTKLQ